MGLRVTNGEDQAILLSDTGFAAKSSDFHLEVPPLMYKQVVVLEARRRTDDGSCARWGVGHLIRY
jgi:hypothetical protein